MAIAVVDRFLRRFVVRIDVDGRLHGSGVLVAPGWVATCAHVVAGLDEVEVVPDPSIDPSPSRRIVGRVRECSDPPHDGSSFWQFPDLAFIELIDWVDHPVAPIGELCPPGRTPVHAWGFAFRESGVEPVGSPASYEFVGEDGDGYLQVQAGEAPRGLSGAPAVCCDAGLVFGLVSVSRDLSQPRGGWISPLRRLDVDGRPEALVARTRDLAQANGETAWRSRGLWSSVVSGRDADDTVGQPWRNLRFEAGMASSLVLRSEYLIVGYVDRHNRLDEAISWCEQRAPVAIARVDGLGGAGKTRFGIELCRAMSDRAWVAGLLLRSDGRLVQVRRPRLVVVDYFDERDAHELADALGALARSASPMFPVRIVLLARPNLLLTEWDSAEALRSESTGVLAGALESASDQSRAAEAFSLEERRTVFHRGFDAFRRSLFPDEVTGEPPEIDLADDRYGAPFDVLLEAYDAAHAQAPMSATGRPAIDRALDHELHHWRTHEPDVSTTALRTAIALATLTTAPTAGDADVLVDLVCGDDQTMRASVDNFVASLYPGSNHWNALAPDRLGEALIVSVLDSHADDGEALVAGIFHSVSDRQVEHSLDVLTRIAGSFGADHSVVGSARRAMLRHHRSLVERAGHQAAPADHAIGRAGLLTALARGHATLVTEPSLANLSQGARSELSASFDELGDLAIRYGRSDEAATIFAHALTLDELRVAAEPANTSYQRDLSVSYNKFGDLALAEGRAEDARGLYQQSLDVAERLAAAEPANTSYQRDLSISYERLGDLAERAGDTRAASRCFADASRLRESLASQAPDRVDLAVEWAYVVYRLALLDPDEGRLDEGRRRVFDRLSRLAENNRLDQRGQLIFAWAHDPG